MVGPTDDGKFLQLKVCSIQRNRSACRVLRAGQAATLALGHFDRSLLRKVSPPLISGSYSFKTLPLPFLGTVSMSSGYCEELQMIVLLEDTVFSIRVFIQIGNSGVMAFR